MGMTLTVTVTALAGAASYLMGAVPCGFLVAKSRGVDIRTRGSGNIGATNVFRVVGKPWGILTFLLDFLKGLAAATVVPAAAAALLPQARDPWFRVMCAALSVVGHNWTVFLRFRGGKGIATSAGAVLGLSWPPVAAAAVAWCVVLFATRYVSVASMASAATLVAAGWLTGDAQDIVTPAVLTVLGAVAIARHRGNIVRLARGEEHRFSFGQGRKGS